MNRLKFILLILLMSCPFVGKAQEKYTAQLKKQHATGAVVVVHQDAELEALVNGDPASTNVSQDEEKPEKTSGPHTKIDGYRIQIYMAGNTAQDKNTVMNWARRFKNSFSNVNAYVYFTPPHWVCAVGDYRTREDATVMLEQIRSTSQFNSAHIVRSKINYYY
ncbi:MAG: hypothetical protein MJZ60_11075 [Bacteroidaceae bacterium]|nr:hypothetical protein [Bacteroidaceae bacterium]